MSKYTIEGNINFQEELYKLLDEDSDDEDNLCQITGLKLDDKFVTLECKHKFNYKALYTEIYKQKFEFKTYPLIRIKKKEIKDLPDVLNDKIFYYLSHPCADIMRQYINDHVNFKEALICVSRSYRRQALQDAEIHVGMMDLDLEHMNYIQ